MDDNKIYTGYHSTTKECALDILSNGFKMPCFKNESDPLKQEKFL